MSMNIDWGNLLWWGIGLLAVLAILAVLKFLLKVAAKVLTYAFVAIVVLAALLVALHYFGLY